MSKFVKGQSGNPAGRPPGSKSFQAELRAALEEHGEEILEKLIERGSPRRSTAAAEGRVPAFPSRPWSTRPSKLLDRYDCHHGRVALCMPAYGGLRTTGGEIDATFAIQGGIWPSRKPVIYCNPLSRER